MIPQLLGRPCAKPQHPRRSRARCLGLLHIVRTEGVCPVGDPARPRRAAWGAEDRKGVLFRSAERRVGRLNTEPTRQADVYRVIQHRAAAANVMTKLGCHSLRVRGTIIYLKNGGQLEHAQWTAAHASARMLKLYNRRDEGTTLVKVEQMSL